MLNERPDAILNIVDGTNLERNLYLSTQLLELGIPVVMAVNMMDVVEKNGDKIHIHELSKALGCKVVEISALKGTGIKEAAELAVKAAASKQISKIVHTFDSQVETVLQEIETQLGNDVPENQKRFFTIKLFERDQKIGSMLKTIPNVETSIKNWKMNWMTMQKVSLPTNGMDIFLQSLEHAV